MISRLRLLCGLCVFCALEMSCSSSPHLDIFKTDTEWVDLREWPSTYHQPSPNTHPYSITPQRLHHVLRSAYYKESTLFSFVMSGPRQVFTDEQVKRLSYIFSEAFDQALPQEVVSFRIREAEESFRYTKGFCFILENELHLIIEDLRLSDFQSKETAPQPNTSKWRFAPRESQRLYADRSEGKETNPHWLSIRLETRGHPNGM